MAETRTRKMPKKRKLANVKERCRVCLTEDGCMSNLFDKVLQSKLNDLIKCTSVNIKDELGLPNIICHVCLYKLDTWSEFKEQFIRSNQVLLNQLELSTSTDNVNLQLKRSHNDSEQSTEDSLSDTSEKKKPKTEIPPLIPLEYAKVDCIKEQTTIKEIYISDDEVTSSKDSSQRAHNVSNDDKGKNNEGHEGKKDDSQAKPSLVPMKVKLLSAKRSRTTEQRKASTKRWVARKRALLAATGESVSDTDSMGSDDTQLSPVQKARAKTNLDKETEKQRRLARALKNLETNLAEKYVAMHDSSFMSVDNDSDIRRTRSFKEVNTVVTITENKSISVKERIQQDEVKNDKSIEKGDKEKENSPIPLPEDTVTEPLSKTDETQASEETFTPCSVKSELEIGDATYIVTSTLTLAEPHYLNKTNLNSLSRECRNGSVDRSSQEKNTDIIDAVQLRRINPIPMDPSDKKCIERCLNIEVEGTEIEALKRVQVELASFVEKEMKDRLFGAGKNDAKRDKVENVCKNSYQTLDQQLKNIIEKTIKKNFESSMMRSCNSELDPGTQKPGRVSPTFLKEAVQSKKYQPKVLLKRLDVAKEKKQQTVNNVHTVSKRTVKNKLGGPFSMVSHKRQSVPPIRYNDYNTFALDSDSNMSDEIEISESIKIEHNHTVQKSQEVKGQTAGMKKQAGESKVTDPNAAAVSGPSRKSEQKLENEGNAFKTSSQPEEKHTCSICEQSFNSREEAAAHVRVHKAESSVPRHNKHKMMRCKRCHEIVEARFVKAHVCKSTRQHVHKCYVCNSTFRTEKLLVRHLESHDQSEFNIENITKVEAQKSNVDVAQNSKEVAYLMPEKDQLLKEDGVIGKSEDRIEVNNIQSEQAGIMKGLRVDSQGAEKPKEAYTCFVCDKIFTDKEVLKDHLQKHCDDMSEDDQSAKEQYQCAICGDSLDSEDALEAHVEKHLFDEEDDNPNLINIANDNEKLKDEPYHCLQCAESFNSEMLLEMHMQAHEEEAAIAEWEKQGIKAYEYQCMICDELFETEEELSEHLDVHNGNAHVCQLCDKPFTTLEDLQKHVATH